MFMSHLIIFFCALPVLIFCPFPTGILVFFPLGFKSLFNIHIREFVSVLSLLYCKCFSLLSFFLTVWMVDGGFCYEKLSIFILLI